MDEDDGMMLNFAAPSASQTVAKKVPKMTKGRWRDRRRVQMELKGKPIKDTSTGASGANQVPVQNKKETVRQPYDREMKKRKAVRAENGGNAKRAKGEKDESYVSSLFTANPEVKKRDYDQTVSEDVEATNAPLLNDESADFKALGVNEAIVKALEGRMKYAKPTRIQRAVIPALLSQDRDLFVQAQTGSGKTLAFTLPIVQKLMDASDGTLNRKSGIFAVILSPTRELASQTYEFLATQLCSACHWIVPGLIIGGEKKKSEKARIRKGVNILVATPGRMADHIETTEKLDLSKVRYLVLDEGDRLMDLGFEEAITRLLDRLRHDFSVNLPFNLRKALPAKRVNILCSATLKEKTKKLDEISLTDARVITADKGTDVAEMKAPEQLVQEVLVVPPKLRFVTLSATLRNLSSRATDSTKTIVFFSCSTSVDFHFIALTRGGKRLKMGKKPEQKDKKDVKHRKTEEDIKNVTAETAPLIGSDTVIYKLHGSLSQQARTATLSHFSKDSTHKHCILLCTDVASRGLDLPNIKSVVEYDPPFTQEDHLHRVGRTARVGSEGSSVLFLLPGDEEKYIHKIEPLHSKGSIKYMDFQEVLKQAFAQEEDEEDKKKSKNKRKSKNIPMREGNWDTHATTFQLDLERWLMENARAKEIAADAFVSHTRAYTTHLAADRDCFNVKRLHLGHLAKSFGLRETPKKLAGQSAEGHAKKKENSKNKMIRLAEMAEKAMSEEFNTI